MRDQYSWISSIRLRKNIGKSDTFNIGLLEIFDNNFDYIVFMDGDGQGDSEEVIKLELIPKVRINIPDK